MLAAALFCTSVQALTLSSAELDAAAQLGCVLAEDALGYLNEDQFNDRFDTVVSNFSESQVDVIYAKALGYIDGLLFGLSSRDSAVAAKRLEAYSNSNNCGFGMSAVSLGVSL
jgi:hypothetical protein